MTKKFTHDARDGRTLNIQVVVVASNEVDAYADIEWIGDQQDNEVKLDSLDPVDQLHIEQHAQEIADDNAHDAWFDRKVREADFYEVD